MERRIRWPSAVARVLISLVAGVVLGCIVQTQINLMDLANLGVTVDLRTRATTTAQDLLHFSPLYTLILGVSLALSLPAAAAALRVLGWRRSAPVYALAAALALWLALTLINSLAPMPTLIAATRGTGGLLALLATAACAGWLFGAVRPRARRGYRCTWLGVGGLPALVFGLSLSAHPVGAWASEPYRVATVAEGLEHPWSLAFLPDGRALVTERVGRLRLLDPEGRLVPEPIDGVPEVFSSGQAGLFDVLVSKTFETDAAIFWAYACGSANANHLCVARGQLRDRQLVEVAEIFRTQPAKRGNAHYGGRLAWLPDDTLIVTLGEGYDYREQAQNLDNHLGTVVRLEPDGSAPADNPFIGRNDARPEIYSYGHRNVQGVVYDAVSERLIAHEHGPRGGDEVNVLEPGKNYGWPAATYGVDYSGAVISPFKTLPGMESPLLHWTPSIAPSGMALYRGDLFPEWQGSLLVGALRNRSVHRVVLDEGGGARDVETLFVELNERIRDVVIGPESAVYLVTDSPQGRVLRVTPGP